MTSLPKVDSTEVQLAAGYDSSCLSAYKICLKYEEELATFEDKLRHVRIAGFLLLHAPSQGVRSQVTHCILSHKDRNDLIDLGRSFERGVILPMARSGGKPPVYNTGHDTDDITRAPSGPGEAKHRALMRDGWRCIATGGIDYESDHHVDVDLDQEPYGCATDCCYIVPVALVTKRTKMDHSSSIIAVLHHGIRTVLAENVHSLRNVFTMDCNTSGLFNRLQMYFEATQQPQQDTYQVVVSRSRKWLPHVREQVTFSTTDPVNLPVLAPELLGLHATCCKVARLSGVFEHVNSLLGDREY